MTQATTPATYVQRASGKGRDPWRIREFLAGIIVDGKPLSMSAVARMAKTYPHVAQETVRGVRNHKDVLKVLETLGCPKEYLYGKSAAQGRRAA